MFALTNGPGDSPESKPLDMTVIFEFALPIDANRDVPYWANRWHELAAFENLDEPFKAHLEGIVGEYVRRDSINQVRTNERVFDWDWQLREFLLIGDQLTLAPTEDTPDRSLNGTPALVDFVKANSADVLVNKHRFPQNMVGGESFGAQRWILPGVNEPVRKAFARRTCNGCHQTEETPVDVNFHISPYKTGIESLSLHMHNPADPNSDELHRRALDMNQAMCE